MLLEYIKSTPFLLIIVEVIVPTVSLSATIMATICGYIENNVSILLLAFIIIVLCFSLIVYRIKRNYINLKSLYLNEDTFLAHMITNITEVRRLKEKEKINNVSVKTLDMNFQINEPGSHDSVQSEMGIIWKIHCKNLNKELINYHFLCSKSESKKKFDPKIEVKEFNETYPATLTNCSNGLYNHIALSFKNGNLPEYSDFELKIELNNYYRFMWNDCEVLFINAAMFGNSVEKINVKIIFKDSRVANKNISVYEVNNNNFSRVLIQQSSCQLCSNQRDYEYLFQYTKKSSNKFFIIAIPKN